MISIQGAQHNAPSHRPACTTPSLPLMPWLSTVIPFWLKPKAKPVGITTLVASVRCPTSRIGPHPVFSQSHIPFSAKVRILKMDSPEGETPQTERAYIYTHIYIHIYIYIHPYTYTYIANRILTWAGPGPGPGPWAGPAARPRAQGASGF